MNSTTSALAMENIPSDALKILSSMRKKMFYDFREINYPIERVETANADLSIASQHNKVLCLTTRSATCVTIPSVHDVSLIHKIHFKNRRMKRQQFPRHWALGSICFRAPTQIDFYEGCRFYRCVISAWFQCTVPLNAHGLARKAIPDLFMTLRGINDVVQCFLSVGMTCSESSFQIFHSTTSIPPFHRPHFALK